MPHLDLLANALVTLLVTIDPAGLAPLFLSITAGMNRRERFQVALRGCIISGAILLTFAITGSMILNFLGITIGAFRIAGGLLLFWIAFEMIFEKRQERHERSARRAISQDQIRNTAVFPLAIPLIAGPGSISAVILLSSSFSGPVARAELVGVILISLIATFLMLIIAERLDRLMGETGRIILTRLLGVILAALAVQFVVDGIKAVMV